MRELEGLIFNKVIKNHREKSNSIAFYDNGTPITYSDFYYICLNTIDFLKANGVEYGDRVGFWSLNNIEWLAFYFSLSAIGGVCIPINTRSTKNEFNEIIKRTDAKFIFAQLEIGRNKVFDFIDDIEDFEKKLILCEKNTKGLFDLRLKKFKKYGVNDEKLELNISLIKSNSLNILFATSGTTSESKLVSHTQETISTHSENISNSYGFDQEGVVFITSLPLNGVFGFNAAIGCFYAGKPIVLIDKFDADKVLDLINKYHVTHMFGSDEMYRRLLPLIDKPLSSPRVFGYAAFSPDYETLGTEAEKKGIPMFGLYGSSEVQALFSLQSADSDLIERLHAGGVPCNTNASIRIVKFEDRRPVELGEVGEIEIKSKSNFSGYLNNDIATNKVMTSDGYFITGDYGYLRNDGSFVYLGRKGDSIRLGGYLVDPKEIENKIKNLKSIKDVAVVGVEANNNLYCVAFYIENEKIENHPMIIKNHLQETISPYKIPKFFYRLNKLPVTQSENGFKVKRAELRSLALNKIEKGEGCE